MVQELPELIVQAATLGAPGSFGIGGVVNDRCASSSPGIRSCAATNDNTREERA